MSGSPAAIWRARFVALWLFEIRAQWREPLTTLYVLVFGFLTLGYIGTDAVQLVSNRGTVPRTSPWALMLAFGGLTAFGQVITTMITTTAMLRDEALRTRALIAASGVGGRTWFAARVMAALVVMMLVYAVMPLGVTLGVMMEGGAPVANTIMAALRAYLVVTMPTMLIVTPLLSCAAAATQRVLGVLAAALALVGLWQLSLAMVAPTVTAPAVRLLGALLDPFGNAPVLSMTLAWTAEQRSTLDVPLTGVLLLNRVLWSAFAMGATTGFLVVRGGRLLLSEPVGAVTGATNAAAYARLSTRGSAASSVRAFAAMWMQRDGGWRIVSALAAVNALANGAARAIPPGGDPPAAVLLLVSEHARIFLILLATVYAGELVWRERDVRVNQIVDALPVSRAALLRGRMGGLLQGQLAIVAPIAAGALLLAFLRGGHTPATTVLGWWMAWSVFVLWLPFALLTVLSLAVHVLLDHKVGAHLLLIAGWVAVTALSGQGEWPWYVRFAEPAPLLLDGRVPWGLHAQRGAYWSAVGAALLAFCGWRWPLRGIARSA